MTEVVEVVGAEGEVIEMIIKEKNRIRIGTILQVIHSKVKH
jgi:hypothetical protein